MKRLFYSFLMCGVLLTSPFLHAAGRDISVRLGNGNQYSVTVDSKQIHNLNNDANSSLSGYVVGPVLGLLGIIAHTVSARLNNKLASTRQKLLFHRNAALQAVADEEKEGELEHEKQITQLTAQKEYIENVKKWLNRGGFALYVVAAIVLWRTHKKYAPLRAHVESLTDVMSAAGRYRRDNGIVTYPGPPLLQNPGLDHQALLDAYSQLSESYQNGLLRSAVSSFAICEALASEGDYGRCSLFDAAQNVNSRGRIDRWSIQTLFDAFINDGRFARIVELRNHQRLADFARCSWFQHRVAQALITTGDLDAGLPMLNTALTDAEAAQNGHHEQRRAGRVNSRLDSGGVRMPHYPLDRKQNLALKIMPMVAQLYHHRRDNRVDWVPMVNRVCNLLKVADDAGAGAAPGSSATTARPDALPAQAAEQGRAIQAMGTHIRGCLTSADPREAIEAMKRHCLARLDGPRQLSHMAAPEPSMVEYSYCKPLLQYAFGAVVGQPDPAPGNTTTQEVAQRALNILELAYNNAFQRSLANLGQEGRRREISFSLGGTMFMGYSRERLTRQLNHMRTLFDMLSQHAADGQHTLQDYARMIARYYEMGDQDSANGLLGVLTAAQVQDPLIRDAVATQPLDLTQRA